MKEEGENTKARGATQSDEEREKLKSLEVDHIKELRERLYARGNVPQKSIRHDLATPRQIHQGMDIPEHVSEPFPKSALPHVAEPITPTQALPTEVVEKNTMTAPVSIKKSKRRTFRKVMLILGGVFFVGAIAVSSVMLFFGNNTISGENISITTTGPIAVGAGEELNFQVSVANENAVAIQSATLIIEYPEGTQSAVDLGKELPLDRQQLNTIDAGELVNVPVKALIFGEENEEKEVKVSIDYRIQGSNAIFHKEATPLKFKVSTSPVVMTFDTLKNVSSGQEFEIKLVVQSNSPTELSNILVKTTYPEGFDFSSAKPDTVSGEDTWKIKTLKPNEKQTIVIKGLLTGVESQASRFTAAAGVASEDDRNALASQLATARTEIAIEQPFLDVGMSVNDSQSETVAVSADTPAHVNLTYKNSLDTTLYDGSVLVELSGNALDEFEVKPSRGFYDSANNTIKWDSVDVSELKEVLPGRVVRFDFEVTPRDSVGKAPELTMKATVKGQRVFENQVPQELVGTAERTIRIQSVTVFDAYLEHGSGLFTNTGPVPPVAEKVTQYTISMTARAGTNDLTNAEMTAVLPSYVSWLDLVSDGDVVSYNPTTRVITWTIGDMSANEEKNVSMQISFRPSLSQVNTIPTILETQRFKATDRFTSTVVRNEHAALTTALLGEADENLRRGEVRESE